MSWLTGIFTWGLIREGVESWTLGGAAKSALGSAVAVTAVGTLAGRGKGLLALGGACHMDALPHNTQLLEHQLPKVEGDIACSGAVGKSLLGKSKVCIEEQHEVSLSAVLSLTAKAQIKLTMATGYSNTVLWANSAGSEMAQARCCVQLEDEVIMICKRISVMLTQWQMAAAN